MSAPTSVTVHLPGGASPGRGVLIEATSVLVTGSMGPLLGERPEAAVGASVRLDSPAGDRTEVVGVVRVHVVSRGGPYVVLELAVPTALPVSPAPRELVVARTAAVGPDVDPDERVSPLCMIAPWLPGCRRR
ncbi:hypothetical protein [Pseudonocardia alni]|uniref:hypothetical protein n=1 Tax=Pseudonocardia alni TaxID=33907 RepID=UPI0033292CAB